LSHKTSPFSWWVLFEIGSHKLFALGWLQTSILLISASWVARIVDVSHHTQLFIFIFLKTDSYNVAQAGLSMWSSCLSLLSTRIPGIYQTHPPYSEAFKWKELTDFQRQVRNLYFLTKTYYHRSQEKSLSNYYSLLMIYQNSTQAPEL
jgi:uncharacterized protein (UPF0262 family)